MQKPNIGYLETFYQVVEFMTLCDKEGTNKVMCSLDGIGGRWELAENLTDKFEELYKNEDWTEIDWFDTLDEYLNNYFTA